MFRLLYIPIIPRCASRHIQSVSLLIKRNISKKYSATLNLPKTSLPLSMKDGSTVKREIEIQKASYVLSSIRYINPASTLWSIWRSKALCNCVNLRRCLHLHQVLCDTDKASFTLGTRQHWWLTTAWGSALSMTEMFTLGAVAMTTIVAVK